jgi:hypothetical protein
VPIFATRQKSAGNRHRLPKGRAAQAGDLIVGTGGARKMRHAGRGRGKSGGYRTIHYWGGADVPIFLLSIYGKGTKDSLSNAEKRQLEKILSAMAEEYRQGVRRRLQGRTR